MDSQISERRLSLKPMEMSPEHLLTLSKKFSGNLTISLMERWSKSGVLVMGVYSNLFVVGYIAVYPHNLKEQEETREICHSILGQPRQGPTGSFFKPMLRKRRSAFNTYGLCGIAGIGIEEGVQLLSNHFRDLKIIPPRAKIVSVPIKNPYKVNGYKSAIIKSQEQLEISHKIVNDVSDFNPSLPSWINYCNSFLTYLIKFGKMGAVFTIVVVKDQNSKLGYQTLAARCILRVNNGLTEDSLNHEIQAVSEKLEVKRLELPQTGDSSLLF